MPLHFIQLTQALVGVFQFTGLVDEVLCPFTDQLLKVPVQVGKIMLGLFAVRDVFKNALNENKFLILVVDSPGIERTPDRLAVTPVILGLEPLHFPLLAHMFVKILHGFGIDHDP